MESWYRCQRNEGVTATLTQNDGTIGYVEYGYASKNGLKMAALQNKEKNYVTPSVSSASETLAQVVLPSNLRAFISNPVGAKSYPIVTYTWILAYKKYENPEMAKALKDVLKWCVNKDGGQKLVLN